jgi:hypothetical protein
VKTSSCLIPDRSPTILDFGPRTAHNVLAFAFAEAVYIARGGAASTTMIRMMEVRRIPLPLSLHPVPACTPEAGKRTSVLNTPA